MSEMVVERVAIAIWSELKLGEVLPALTYDRWADKNEYVQGIARRCARAAIQAMREPTLEILMAGDAAVPYVDGWSLRGTAPAVWRAMIDAALKPASAQVDAVP